MSQCIADELEQRRGLVLGLTLAEVLLLLLFLLILSLSWRLIALQRVAADEHQNAETLAAKVKLFDGTITALAPLLAALQTKGALDTATIDQFAIKLLQMDHIEEENANLKRENSSLASTLGNMRLVGSDPAKLKAINDAVSVAAKIDPDNPPEALIRSVEILKRLGADTKPDQIKDLSQLVKDSDKLKSFESAMAAATLINPNDPPEAVARGLDILSRLGPDTKPDQIMPIEEQTSLAGQLDRTRRERDNLIHSGNGLTYPSCWLTSAGQTEYIFDVTIQDDGLVVRDATPSRGNDPALKLVGGFGRNVVIKESLFNGATVELFKYSQKQNCRFYSIIRDQTGPTSKRRYKELRTLVESHFYPLLRSDAWAERAESIPVGNAQMGGEHVPVREGRRPRQN